MEPDIINLENEQTLDLVSDIVSAYVSSNPVPASELPNLIASVHASLSALGGAAPAEPVAEQKPAVNPKKSVFPDYIICLEDGVRLKSMKRHLSNLGLTPNEYRAKWKLASDYPMVAPNYAAQRSELAKALGLGRKKQEPAPVALPARKPRAKKAVAANAA